MEQKFYLNSEEVQKLLRVSSRTLYNYRDEGRLKYIRISRKNIRYKPEDVFKFIQENYYPSCLKDNLLHIMQEKGIMICYKNNFSKK